MRAVLALDGGLACSTPHAVARPPCAVLAHSVHGPDACPTGFDLRSRDSNLDSRVPKLRSPPRSFAFSRGNLAIRPRSRASRGEVRFPGAGPRFPSADEISPSYIVSNPLDKRPGRGTDLAGRERDLPPRESRFKTRRTDLPVQRRSPEPERETFRAVTRAPRTTAPTSATTTRASGTTTALPKAPTSLAGGDDEQAPAACGLDWHAGLSAWPEVTVPQVVQGASA